MKSFAARSLALLALASAAACAAAGSPASAGAAPGQAPADGGAQKVVQELYGERIAAVKASAGEDDDLDLARQLLAGASDASHPAALRHLLARTAMQLALPLGSAAGADLARAALATADETKRLAPIEKAALEKDIADAAYRRAQAEMWARDRLRPLAAAVARAQLAHARLLLAERDSLKDAEAAVQAARNLVSGYQLLDQVDTLKDTEESLRRAKVRDFAFLTARNKLQAAKESGNELAVVAASLELGNLCLEHDGDLVGAAKYLSVTEDPRKQAVIPAAAFLSDPGRFDPATGLAAVPFLVEIARGLPEIQRRKIAGVAVDMLQAYLKTNPPAIGAAKARLLKTEVEGLLGKSPLEKLRQALAASVGEVHGKLEFLGGSRIRLSYDFSDPIQFKDWDRRSGTWEVGKGVLGCVTDPYSGEVANKVRFRLDRPFRLSFAARAKYSIGASLNRADKPSPYYSSSASITLSSYYLSSSIFGISSSDRYRPTAFQPYRFEFNGDGNGLFAWLLDGAIVRKQPNVNDKLYEGAYEVQLSTSYTSRTVTSFDDVVVEGEVAMPEPKKDPTPKPAKKPVAD